MIKELVSVVVMAVAMALGVALSVNCSKQDGKVLRVGVTSGPHAQIMEVVAVEARKRGVDVKIVEFSDYVQPNAALVDGALDVNSFQHVPFLDQQRRDRGYEIEVVGTTVTFPIAAYSTRHADLAAVPKGGTLAIPNDPTNGARALRLLEAAGFFRLPEGKLDVSLRDVAFAEGVYVVRELDAAQLTRALGDVDLAVINTNYALEAGLDTKRALARESAYTPYANVLVARRGGGEREDIRALVAAYQSPEVRAYVESTFKGAVIAAW